MARLHWTGPVGGGINAAMNRDGMTIGPARAEDKDARILELDGDPLRALARAAMDQTPAEPSHCARQMPSS